jgi:hypothetical protein
MVALTNVKMDWENGMHIVTMYGERGSYVLYRGEHLVALRMYEAARESLDSAEARGAVIGFGY